MSPKIILLVFFTVKVFHFRIRWGRGQGRGGGGVGWSWRRGRQGRRGDEAKKDVATPRSAAQFSGDRNVTTDPISPPPPAPSFELVDSRELFWSLPSFKKLAFLHH